MHHLCNDKTIFRMISSVQGAECGLEVGIQQPFKSFIGAMTWGCLETRIISMFLALGEVVNVDRLHAGIMP